MKLKRRDFQLLAKLRSREAQVLLDSRCWEGAYYLAGYAVECGLKACIARSTERYEFPDKARVNSSYSHDFDQLLDVAGLGKPLREATAMQPQFASNWRVVKGPRALDTSGRPRRTRKPLSRLSRTGRTAYFSG